VHLVLSKSDNVFSVHLVLSKSESVFSMHLVLSKSKNVFSMHLVLSGLTFSVWLAVLVNRADFCLVVT